MNDLTSDIPQFLSAIGQLVPASAIKVGDELAPYQCNTIGVRRTLIAAIRVSSAAQVEKIVHHANIFKVALYPVSTGKNWGLGSSTPVVDNCVILDLSAMNAILEINTEFGYARIEPGVTQAQLADALAGMNAPFFLDVTGSGKDTSILGNTLERGTAYNSLRVETLVNLDLVLGTGERLTTGFGAAATCKTTNLYPYGVGPDMCGLFLQSNYGICVAACIKLLPRQESHAAFIASIRNTHDLGAVVDSLRELFNDKILHCIVHIGNERRRDISLTPVLFNKLDTGENAPSREFCMDLIQQESKGEWSAVGAIMGTHEQVGIAKKRIKLKLKQFGDVTFMDERKYRLLCKIAKVLSLKRKTWFLQAIESLIGLTQGLPTNEMLRSVYWPAKNREENWLQPDAGDTGIYFCTPVLPMNNESVHQALSIIADQALQFQVHPAVTMNTLLGRVLECVISIDFIKTDPASVTRAHDFISTTLDIFIRAGFPPYRVDIENMGKVVDENKTNWQIVRHLKSVFDPNNIIAPGRYNRS